MTLADLDFSRALDAEFRAASGLSDRRFYSIFYSRVTPSPLMILGINPGGNPETWTMPEDADEFCSQWQHDYVDESYSIQAAMLPLLTSTLEIDPDVVRRIPKTNVVFRRSSSEGTFERQQGITMESALAESAPVLRQIVERVLPKVIIFEGLGALARFVAVFGHEPLGPSLVPPVTTPNGRYQARIYAVHKICTTILPYPVTAIALGHPSKYAARAEFEVARSDMRARLADVAAELRALGPPTTGLRSAL